MIIGTLLPSEVPMESRLLERKDWPNLILLAVSQTPHKPVPLDQVGGLVLILVPHALSQTENTASP